MPPLGPHDPPTPTAPVDPADDAEAYRALVEHSPEAAYVVRDGRIAYVNPAAVRLFGADSADRLLGMDVLDRVHPEDHALALARRRMVLEEGVPAPLVEMRFVSLDGRIFEVEIQATRIVFGGRPATYAAARDISARKRLEAQVRDSQKLEAVGRLAGGIAHDFNNTLAVILGHCEMLLADTAAGDPRREELEAIHRAAQHSAALTRQLLAYARRQPLAPRAVDLNRAVEDTLRMLRPLLGENVTLEWRPSEGTCPVVLDPAQLDQILTNLCANARDAIDDVGSLHISTRRVTLDATAAAAIPGATAGEYVCLSCRDSGRGIPAELLERIFEPFFTTKPQGRGTGLGLSTVYGIVRQHRGAISVKSTLDVGTQFDIYFPRHHEDARTVTPPQGLRHTPPDGDAARATVLVVEDESAVLQLTCRALTAQGYHVLAADGPETALRLLSEHAQGVDLLLTDVMMPVMSGPELARRVTARNQDIRVLFMSGYSADLIARSNQIDAETELLSKPFTLAELMTRVRAALERRPAA